MYFSAADSKLKQNRISCVNVFSEGSPSRSRMVLRISFGITTHPKSSILLTIPVAFILCLLFMVSLFWDSFDFSKLLVLSAESVLLMSQLSLEDICLSFCRDTALEILALRQQGGGFLPCLTTKILRIYSSRFNWYINNIRRQSDIDHVPVCGWRNPLRLPGKFGKIGGILNAASFRNRLYREIRTVQHSFRFLNPEPIEICYRPCMKILTEQPAQITFRRLSHMRKSGTGFPCTDTRSE